MLKDIRSIVAVLDRRFRSRAVLELENLALVISCTCFAANGRVGPDCLRSTACCGSGFTDYGRTVWMRWCWSRRPPSSNGTVRASACFGVGVRDQDGHQWIARFGIRFGKMNAANPLWGA